MARLQAEQVDVSYENKQVLKNISVDIPEGKITSIIGPNGCGKSTILKSLSRILTPEEGGVYLDGKSIHEMKTKDVAKNMAMLAQTPDIPLTLTVEQLVSFGRHPHRKRTRKLTSEDREAIQGAMKDTGVLEFADRTLDSLSGGQRQRAWIAMALAQDTDLLLLDEPTTYLDMAHQLEVLELLQKLNEKESRTIVMVLHDLNHAARFSDHLIAMCSGEVQCIGCPNDVICKNVLRQVFGIDAHVVTDPKSGKPLCMTYDLIERAPASATDLSQTN
ncbi:ABC transporter ATP-binding protein [Marinococcus luteus]|uniref:ABC transporter ATP-binding protein n=1 Tax=Marinococcus luteus TaxID=1122204 RepID=UPI002ACCE712|nr:ABC transporter ATP-binding protein [Marinococcus luteus]MDZ5783207.1 ABC transporter ATP-binding protein [Marinococcus luteus]